MCSRENGRSVNGGCLPAIGGVINKPRRAASNSKPRGNRLFEVCYQGIFDGIPNRPAQVGIHFRHILYDQDNASGQMCVFTTQLGVVGMRQASASFIYSMHFLTSSTGVPVPRCSYSTKARIGYFFSLSRVRTGLIGVSPSPQGMLSP